MNTVSTPKPVLIAMSILAGADVLTAGSAFSNLIGLDTAAFIILILAAIKVGMAFYLQGQVTPFSNVVAYQPDTTKPTILAGGAAAYGDSTAVSPGTTIAELQSAA